MSDCDEENVSSLALAYKAVWKLIRATTDARGGEFAAVEDFEQQRLECLWADIAQQKTREEAQTRDGTSSSTQNMVFLLSEEHLVTIVLPCVLATLKDTEKESICVLTTECLVALLERIRLPVPELRIIETALQRGQISQPPFSRMACSRILGAVSAFSKLPVAQIKGLYLSKVCVACRAVALH